MPHTCFVNGCTNRANDATVKRSFFLVPAIIRCQGERTLDLSTQRRASWIARIDRKKAPTKYSRVCSDHFLSGKPADLYNTTHPDWAPSVSMSGGDRQKQPDEQCLKRYNKVKGRQATRVDHTAAEALLDLSHPPEADKSCEKRVECFHSDCNHVQGQDTCKFFMWPTDEESLTKWQIVSDRRPDCKRDANSRLCSCHFEKHKKANGPTIYKPINSGPMTFKVVKQRKILASPHRKSRKVKRLPTEANLEFNQLGETSQMQFDDDVFPQADCKDSALTAMDGSLDSGYTISVKTEEEKADLLTEQTLQIIEPRHWTVNDRGVLVNADESEVAIKLEKPDWTIENVMADCSTIMAGQGDGESKDGILIAKEEDSLSSDPHEIAVGH